MIDLARGAAVRARGGERARYRPLESVLIPGRRGDAVALAQAYREKLGARECYVADLDAIQGGDLQRGLLGALVPAAAPGGLLVDAGTGRPEAALEVLDLGARSVVVGLETLRRFDDLERIVAAAGAHRVIFSLDLHLGRPMLLAPGADGDLVGLSPEELAARAVHAGARTLLVLDVGRVGSGGGVDVVLLQALRERFPVVRILAGGGVADSADLERIRGAGCDGVLVGTALHTGRLGQSGANATRQVAD